MILDGTIGPTDKPFNFLIFILIVLSPDGSPGLPSHSMPMPIPQVSYAYNPYATPPTYVTPPPYPTAPPVLIPGPPVKFF